MTGKVPEPARPPRAGHLVDLALCALATAASALLYERFFAGAGELPVLCGAAAGGALLGGLGALRRWSAVRTVVVGAAVLAVFLCYAAFPETLRSGLPTSRTLSEVAWGVAGGWARMLSVGVPAEPTGDLLATPAVIGWSAAMGASVIALRRRSATAPLLPPLAAFVCALVLVGRSAAGAPLGTAVFLSTALALMLWRGQRSSPRRILAWSPALVVLAAAGLAFGQAHLLASGQERADPRSLYRPPLDINPALNPLSTLKSQLRERPHRTLFTVHIAPGGPAADRIRLAALDTYDGAQWTSSDRFLVAGRELAEDPDLSDPRPVLARIVIEELDGPFLPALGWPRRLDAAHTRDGRFGFSDASGVLATDASRLRGMTYTVTGETRPLDSATAGGAVPSRDDGDDRLRALPGAPPRAMEVLLHRLTDQHQGTYGKLKAVEEYLRLLPYELRARPGHSYAVLDRFLGPRAEGDGTGHAEQHAAAFAVLARMLGVPARVAVGYRLPPAAVGGYRVTTADAHAWPEVHFEGYGWVPFEPTDITRVGLPPKPETETGPAVQPSALPVPGPTASRPPLPPLPEQRREPGPNHAGPVLRLLAAAGAAGLLAVPVAKLVRRYRRRRVGSTTARLVGAWAEAVDRLYERRLRVPSAMTPTEVARHALDDPSIGERCVVLPDLARATTAAVFGDRPPGEEDVRAAWRLEARLRRQLYPSRLSPRRYVAVVSPRPLVGQWRDRRARRRAGRRR